MYRTSAILVLLTLALPATAVAGRRSTEVGAPFDHNFRDAECESWYPGACSFVARADQSNGQIFGEFAVSAVTADEVYPQNQERPAWAYLDLGFVSTVELPQFAGSHTPQVTVVLRVDDASVAATAADHYGLSYAELRLWAAVEHEACGCSISRTALGEPSMAIVTTRDSSYPDEMHGANVTLRFPLENIDGTLLPAGRATVSIGVHGYAHLGPHSAGRSAGSFKASVVSVSIGRTKSGRSH